MKCPICGAIMWFQSASTNAISEWQCPTCGTFVREGELVFEYNETIPAD